MATTLAPPVGAARDLLRVILSQAGPPDERGLRRQHDRKCQPSCKTNADCANSVTGGRVCNVKTSLCVACLASSDCGIYSPLCDTTSNTCVSCLSANDCSSSASGAVCASGNCGRATSADCKGAANGMVCEAFAGPPGSPSPSTGNCGCAITADCPTGSVCPTVVAGGSSQCITACKKNTDCVQSGASVCKTATGMCVGCLTSGDCATSAQGAVCNKTTASCGCSSNADCTASGNGTVCDTTTGTCSCTTNANCSSSAGGKVCQSSSSGVHIPGGPGPASPSSVCCATRTDCPGGLACTSTQVGGSGSCAAACATNTDCTSRAFPGNALQPVCDATSGLCVGCKTGSDCNGSPRGPVCEPNNGTCGCASATDCVSAADGPVCVNGLPYSPACGCKTTADCPTGKTCDPNAFYCK